MDLDTDYTNAFRKQPIGIPAEQIGISHGIGDVGQGLKSNIFLGASTVELGFMGRGKGFRSQPTGSTPESYGKDERQEMRELAKINEVTVTTHASPNIGALSGYNPQEGRFSPAARQDVLD